MKGYLLQEQAFTIGEPVFIESQSSEYNYAVVFEDDSETGYFYALQTDEIEGQEILDAVHIYESGSIAAAERACTIKIIWSIDWLKCALILNDYCHAVFDFDNHGGYNRNEFPPPNETWTKGDRKLTDEMIEQYFS